MRTKMAERGTTAGNITVRDNDIQQGARCIRRASNDLIKRVLVKAFM